MTRPSVWSMVILLLGAAAPAQSADRPERVSQATSSDVSLKYRTAEQGEPRMMRSTPAAEKLTKIKVDPSEKVNHLKRASGEPQARSKVSPADDPKFGKVKDRAALPAGKADESISHSAKLR